MSSWGLGGKYVFRQNVESAMVKWTKFSADRVTVFPTINAEVIYNMHVHRFVSQ
jgi:hypothetical protein